MQNLQEKIKSVLVSSNINEGHFDVISIPKRMFGGGGNYMMGMSIPNNASLYLMTNSEYEEANFYCIRDKNAWMKSELESKWSKRMSEIEIESWKKVFGLKEGQSAKLTFLDGYDKEVEYVCYCIREL